MKIYNIIEEFLGTDNKYATNVYNEISPQRAGEMLVSLMHDASDKSGVKWDEEKDKPYIEGDGWFYRVSIQENEI